MSLHPSPLCLSCSAEALVPNQHGIWSCRTCSREVEIRRAVLDLRSDNDPLAPRVLEQTEEERAMLHALAKLDLGTDWKQVLEELLLELPLDRAEELMQLIREARGAWAPLLTVKAGSALFLGDPRSGTVVALARCGFAITSVDSSLERLAFAGHRNRALVPSGCARAVLRDPNDRLPFADHSFDLVVRETPFHSGDSGLHVSLKECRRLCARELVVTADNRLGYKQSSGRRGDFRVRTPLSLLVNSVFAKQRTTVGQLGRAIRGANSEFARSRSFSLYPHSRDFTHVAALNSESPRLYVGPKERKNSLKMFGYRMGLFPLFTPSFALIARRDGNAFKKRRIDNLLQILAERLYVPCPDVEYLLATRGNNALIMTAIPGGDPENSDGRWIVRIPLHPTQERRVAQEQSMLVKLQHDFPTVPIPQPLFDGTIDGIFLTCEQRLAGHSAAQFSGDVETMERLYREASGHFASMVVAPPREITNTDFEHLVSAKYELVARHAGNSETRTALSRMHELARERLIGRRMQRVLRHCDPRSKHIQIRSDGEVLGFYDWGSAEEADFPLCDLLHLIIHERLHRGLPTAGHAWQLARNSGAGLGPGERATIDGYCELLDIDRDVRFAVEEIYPMLVGAMAEKNWDFSRPNWLQRSFGL